MCGIFGYITKHGRGPDLARLKRIATETQQRGRHAFGLAWLGPDARLHTFKRPGAATANLGDLDRLRGATVVIGHCRWATHGAPEDNCNNHPHPAGRGWLVHNGVVHNHANLVRRFHLAPKTQCDSEVLGLLMARTPGWLVRRAQRVAEWAEGRLAVLGVWRDPTRLLIVRHGKPLHFGQTKGGFYFASMPEGLPGKVLSICAASSGVLTYHGGHLRHEAFSIGV